jgi:DNA-binding beta-propeller fold protein YncE
MILFLFLSSCGGELPAEARWPERVRPVGGTPPLAYLTNNGDDTLSVVELATMREIARRPVGLSPVDPEAPHHLAVDPEAGWVWVGLSNVALVEGGGLHGSHGGGALPSYVQRLRLEDLLPDGEVRVDTNLGDVLLAGSGRVASTHFDLTRALEVAIRGDPPEQGYGALVLVDGATMRRIARVPVCTAPHGVAVTSDGALGLVACYGDDALAFVDLRAVPPEVIARVPVGPEPGSVRSVRYGPYAVALSPDGALAFVSTLEGRMVRVIDVAARADLPGRAVLLEGAAFFGGFDVAGARFWAPSQARDGIVEVEVESGAILARRRFTPEECIAPHEAVYVASIDRVVVACEGDHVGPGRVVALEPGTLTVTGAVEVGVYPDAVRVVEEMP